MARTPGLGGSLVSEHRLTRMAKLMRADSSRRSRLHDLQGNIIDLASWPNVPLAAADAVLRIVLHRRRRVPWISYRATRKLSTLIRPSWRALEFGAGASTLWLSRRCASVVSIESDSNWYEAVRSALKRDGKTNVQLHYRNPVTAEYADLAQFPEGCFDLIMIDGLFRRACVEACLGTAKSGGLVFLDNTDRAGDVGLAADLLIKKSVWHQTFIDFAPGLAAPSQGLLVRLS
jgi:hypothetical protein